LYKDTNSAVISLLKSNSEEALDRIAGMVPNKVSDLLDCETITALISHAGFDRVKDYLERELIKLASMFNGNPALNLKDHQVPVIAEMLMENYKWESIEDFTLCFRRASFGMYGEIYRIDGAVIGGWMARYLEEKYDALEQRKAKEKKQESDAKRLFQAVDGSKYIQQMLDAIGPVNPPDQTNGKENAYQRHKLAEPYKPELNDDHYRKILKQEFPTATPEQIEQAIKSRRK
jgi:hypothetical protein